MSALVLYDTTGQWGWLGELYAIMTANLASHFGTWTAMPAVSYTAGSITQYSATIYIGSTYGEPLPTAFLDDVLTTTKPVIWIYDNIWQLTERSSNFTGTYLWNWSGFDFSSVEAVEYKGQSLKRYAANDAGIMNYATVSSSVAVLGIAVRSDGTSFPWALRSLNLTYIGENPLVYMSEGDRYLIFCDLLFDALAPTQGVRHRAIVRLEDIDPSYDPNQLKTIANYLSQQRVPFGFQVVPLYLDPLGVYNPAGTTIHLRDVPAMVSAIKYCQSKGGILIEHGWTHQYDSTDNPYTAVTGDDCEFYRLTLNPDLTVNYVGPLPEDSQSWASGRIQSAAAEFAAAGLAVPGIFTFPNYAGSAVDYSVTTQTFAFRAERALYFLGLLSNGQKGPFNYTRLAGQFFPYTVKDIYCSYYNPNCKVLADTLGGIQPEPFGPTPARLPADIIADAQRTLVVRDGVASFFYNPSDNISYLKATIQGLKNLGYTFVSPTSL